MNTQADENMWTGAGQGGVNVRLGCCIGSSRSGEAAARGGCSGGGTGAAARGQREGNRGAGAGSQSRHAGACRILMRNGLWAKSNDLGWTASSVLYCVHVPMMGSTLPGPRMIPEVAAASCPGASARFCLHDDAFCGNGSALRSRILRADTDARFKCVLSAQARLDAAAASPPGGSPSAGVQRPGPRSSTSRSSLSVFLNSVKDVTQSVKDVTQKVRFSRQPESLKFAP